jgi:hypothetical protein
LARAASDFTVEIKYNGEQWGAPYPVAGGRVPGWYSYSFEDYLSDSGDAPARSSWPGNVSAEGERWPAQPYKIVWQVRANGTQRIFPFYEPELVRRSILAMKLGSATGFTSTGGVTTFAATVAAAAANVAATTGTFTSTFGAGGGIVTAGLGGGANSAKSARSFNGHVRAISVPRSSRRMYMNFVPISFNSYRVLSFMNLFTRFMSRYTSSFVNCPSPRSMTLPFFCITAK